MSPLPALLAVIALVQCATCTPYAHFYPFGEDAGDDLLNSFDDGFAELAMSRGGGFHFYGQNFYNVTINVNGIITFEENNWFYQTGLAPFPFDADKSQYNVDDHMIAPFMEDILANHEGPSSNRIWYRQEALDVALLERAAQDVATAFPCEDVDRPYNPNWIFIVTWDEVKHFYYYYNYCHYDLAPDCMDPFYAANEQCLADCQDHPSVCYSSCWSVLEPGYEQCSEYICTAYEHNNEDLFNTFQVVLTTDGVRSFAFFNYGDIQWTGAYPEDHAQVGFNHGDGYRAHTASVSRTPDVADLDTISNVGVPGRHAFRVDRPFIKDATCAPDVCICQFGDSQYDFSANGRHLATLVNYQNVVSGYDLAASGAVELTEFGEADDPCRFRLVAHVSVVGDRVDLVNAVFFFGVGKNGKYKRNIKLGGSDVKERGQGIGSSNTLDLTEPYVYDADGTHLRLTQHGDVFLIQSESCPYEVEYHKNAIPRDQVTLSAGSNAGPMAGACASCVV